MDEAEYLADRVAIIVHGEIVAEGTPNELVHRDATTTIKLRLGSDAGPLPGGLSAESTDEYGRFTIATDSPTQTLHELTGWALERGLELEELSVSRRSLEDVFVDLAGGTDPEGMAE
jgi:ABC-2 type transport system ATP-binding protein